MKQANLCPVNVKPQQPIPMEAEGSVVTLSGRDQRNKYFADVPISHGGGSPDQGEKTKQQSPSLEKFNAHILSIHSMLIQNLSNKSIERNLSADEEDFLSSIKGHRSLQQAFSGILAIEACVSELINQKNQQVTSFVRGTNLLLINYKFLFSEYDSLRNGVRTMESLSNSHLKDQKAANSAQGDSFLNFFDSLQFLAHLIRNCSAEAEECFEKGPGRDNNGGLSRTTLEALKIQVLKLEELMHAGPKEISEKLVYMHNNEERVIISELQKENNFLRWQLDSKENTITEYEQSLFNVDLSRHINEESSLIKNELLTEEILGSQHQPYYSHQHQTEQPSKIKPNKGFEKQRQDTCSQQISSQIAELCKKLESLSKEKEELQKKLAVRRETLREQNCETGLKERQADLLREIRYISDKNRCLFEENQVLREEIEELQSSLGGFSGRNPSEGPEEAELSKLDSLLEEVEAMKATISNFEEVMQQKESQLQQMRSLISQMNEEFSAQMEKYNTVFYGIRQELAEAKADIEKLTGDNQRLLSHNKSLQEHCLKKEGHLIALQTDIASEVSINDRLSRRPKVQGDDKTSRTQCDRKPTLTKCQGSEGVQNEKVCELLSVRSRISDVTQRTDNRRLHGKSRSKSKKAIKIAIKTSKDLALQQEQAVISNSNRSSSSKMLIQITDAGNAKANLPCRKQNHSQSPNPFQREPRAELSMITSDPTQKTPRKNLRFQKVLSSKKSKQPIGQQYEGS